MMEKGTGGLERRHTADAFDEAVDFIQRRFRLAQPDVPRLRRELGKLARTMAEDDDLTPAERRARKKVRATELKALVTAFGRTGRALDELRPWLRAEIGDCIEAEIARSFSNDAFRDVGVPITGYPATRTIEAYVNRYRTPGMDIARECEALSLAERQMAAETESLAVFRAAMDRLAGCLQRELDRYALRRTGGRPADHRRQFAFDGLWDIYSRLTGARLGPTPPSAYLDLCTDAFPVLGLDTKGLEDAAERLFKGAASKRRASGA